MRLLPQNTGIYICASFIFSLFSCENTNTDDITTSSETKEITLLERLETGEKIRSGKTVTVTDKNPSTFATTLINAVKNAGWGGTVQLGAGSFYSDREIILPAEIKTTIKGAGKDATYLNLTQNRTTSGFLILSTNGTSVQDMTVNAQNKMGYGACAVNTNGAQDVYLYRVGFVNSSIGTGTPDNGRGQNPAGLNIIACSFFNCDHGINFNRQYTVNKVPWVKKMTIDACWFGGTQSAGISIDCGNDGIDGVVFRRDRPGAAEATNIVTNMDAMEIKNCTFEKASKYNIAIAKAWNIKIFNNTLKGNTGSLSYGEAINLEHETHHITIEDNTISNEGLSNLQHSYISILTFRDYGNAPLLENGCRDIIIRRNIFKGDVRTGIAGEYAEKITINNNTFSSPAPTSKYLNFYVKSSNIWHWSNGTTPSQINIVN